MASRHEVVSDCMAVRATARPDTVQQAQQDYTPHRMVKSIEFDQGARELIITPVKLSPFASHSRHFCAHATNSTFIPKAMHKTARR